MYILLMHLDFAPKWKEFDQDLSLSKANNYVNVECQCKLVCVWFVSCYAAAAQVELLKQ